MRFNCILLGLIISGYLLHGMLVYFELKERLSRQLRKYPILWGAVAGGAIIIVIPAVPHGIELGHALRA
jgi:hypothetical protein